MKDMITATEAAKLIGCSQSTVSRWASKLGYAVKYGSSLVLTEKQVQEIAKKRRLTIGNPNFGKK